MGKNSSISFFVLLCIITIIKSWDYKQHGQDWNYTRCSRGQQSPGKVTSDAEELETTNFFFTNFNLKKGQKINGILESIEDNNILSLNFGEGKFGSIIYNMFSWFGYDEEDLQEAQCSNIMIKIPGEHSYEDETSAGELQVNCTFQIEHSDEFRGVFVAIPIKVDDENESNFSKSLGFIVDKGITIDNLPVTIEFDNIDISDGYAMMDKTYYYEAQVNFPPCELKSIWFYVNRPISFSQAVLNQLKECIDKDQCPEGNNRVNFRISDSFVYPQ